MNHSKKTVQNLTKENEQIKEQKVSSDSMADELRKKINELENEVKILREKIADDTVVNKKW